MATAETYTSTGNKANKSATLPKEVFGESDVSQQFLHDTYVTMQSRQRSSKAAAKNRSEVSGGGRKPWRQKGTGRARAGSNRSPIWRGGGVTFGPTGEENYKKRINKTARRNSLRQALSLKASGNQVAVIEEIKTDGKVKSMQTLLDKLSLQGKILIVDESISSELARSAKNIPNVNVAGADDLNIIKVLNADVLLFTRKGLDKTKERLGGLA